MQTIFEFSPIIIAVVPVVLGLVQVVKSVGLPSRFAPLASLAIGVGLIFLVPDLSWQSTVVQGLIAGLAASGLWSGGKATFQG